MNRELIEREHKAIFQTYNRLPIIIESAKGNKIYDKDGKEYLDFLGGIAVNALGHSHPKLIDALTKQLSKYLHVSNFFYQEPQILLAEKLKSITGFDKVFYCNSGTEAIEGALKLVRFWGNQNSREEIISFTGSFHGRTYGALSLMSKEKYRYGMGPFLEGIKTIEYNNLNELKKTVTDKTAGIFIEFLQGESGIISANNEFVKLLMELKQRYKFLLVADEIQSGVGRTGKFFSYQFYDIEPDIVTMAKGIGGGLPIGVILAKDYIASVWGKSIHGTTFGGNALSCTAGLVVIEELMGDVMFNVKNIGDYFIENLKEVQRRNNNKILEIRGKGLMLGIALKFDASILLNKLLTKGIIANSTSGNVLRIVPPLIITQSEVDEFCVKLSECLMEI